MINGESSRAKATRGPYGGLAGLLLFGAVLLPVVSLAGADELGTRIIDLPDFVLIETRVANEVPAETYATPVSALRFEPLVDLQTRNFGEAQGDITIRGGIFEGTAVQLGGLTIFDPQTGHYAAELPVPAAMLGSPRVATGAAHALTGLNATAGTVAYDWRSIESRGEISGSIGNDGFRRGSFYVGQVVQTATENRAGLAFDAEVAHSEGDGTVSNGDHDFDRYAGRMEITNGSGVTRIFAGYQSKFFGWPNLYTPFGVAETENLHTGLLYVGHEARWGDNALVISGYFRRNRDDYEFDRTRPGIFNPYQHETRVYGTAAEWETPVGPWQLHLRGEVAADDIESTSLTAGTFNSRTYYKLSSAVSRRWEASHGSWETLLGISWDDTNREGSAVSPALEIARTYDFGAGDSALRWYAQYSAATRVPGYTALNSSAAGGLFRGNPDLRREKSANIESGVQLSSGDWSLHAAAFFRRDDPLVDWTFSAGAPNARSASEVSIDNSGFELVGRRSFGAVDVVAGYTWLHKDAAYADPAVDASFYALNFPEHRLTVAVVARLGSGVVVRSDTEFRIQQENLLRTAGGGEAVLGSLGLYWTVPQHEALELSIVADNLWGSNFQELPAVPAPGRLVTAGASYHW